MNVAYRVATDTAEYRVMDRLFSSIVHERKENAFLELGMDIGFKPDLDATVVHRRFVTLCILVRSSRIDPGGYRIFRISQSLSVSILGFFRDFVQVYRACVADEETGDRAASLIGMTKSEELLQALDRLTFSICETLLEEGEFVIIIKGVLYVVGSLLGIALWVVLMDWLHAYGMGMVGAFFLSMLLFAALSGVAAFIMFQILQIHDRIQERKYCSW